MQDKILCMYSGGLDSAGALWELLSNPKYAGFIILVHHINIINKIFTIRYIRGVNVESGTIGTERVIADIVKAYPANDFSQLHLVDITEG